MVHIANESVMEDLVAWTDIIGTIAGILVLLSFIPQIMKVTVLIHRMTELECIYLSNFLFYSMASKRKNNKKDISGTEILTMKSRLSAHSLTPLIKSVTSDFEARLLLQDKYRWYSQGSRSICFVSILHDYSRKEK